MEASLSCCSHTSGARLGIANLVSIVSSAQSQTLSPSCLYLLIWIWAFLDQALANRVGESWDGKTLLVEESMLVRSNMLWFQQDIGHNNALPFCRHCGILCRFAQSKKLVVRWDQVSIFQLVLIMATYF